MKYCTLAVCTLVNLGLYLVENNHFALVNLSSAFILACLGLGMLLADAREKWML